MTGGLFKYLFSSFSPLLIYLCFIVTVNIVNTNSFSTVFIILNRYLENINKSKTSLGPTNNVFLFGQKEIISVSTNPVSTVTSYKSLIFFFIVVIFSSTFYKKNHFKITKQILPFLIFFLLYFNGSPPHKSKN